MEQEFFFEMKSIFNIWFVGIMVSIGLFSLLRDGPMLVKEKLPREARIARGLGVAYIVIGVGIYFAFRS